jgi:hypothetical protein
MSSELERPARMGLIALAESSDCTNTSDWVIIGRLTILQTAQRSIETEKGHQHAFLEESRSALAG